MSDIAQPTPEMVEFFETKIRPVKDELFQGVYRFDEVQQQFSRNRTRIQNLHGRDVDFILAINPPKFSGGQTPSFCCKMEQGRPVVTIVVPNLMLSYKKCKQLGQTHTFSVFVVIGLMHEFDHHALGLASNNIDAPVLIEHEKKTWARTCEKTIVPLIEVYNQDVGSLWKFYEAWIRCGKNIDSRAWDEFIRADYEFVVETRKQRIASVDDAIAEMFG